MWFYLIVALVGNKMLIRVDNRGLLASNVDIFIVVPGEEKREDQPRFVESNVDFICSREGG